MMIIIMIIIVIIIGRSSVPVDGQWRAKAEDKESPRKLDGVAVEPLHVSYHNWGFIFMIA